MKLDETDFRALTGHFYGATPTDLIVDRIGHKTVHFNHHGHGAFVYLNAAERTQLHAQQYPATFDLMRWLQAHRDQIGLLVTTTPVPALKADLPQFIVPDAWAFYKEVAAYCRQRYFGNIITVTGSVGKSTTRLMLVTLLRALKQQVITNVGNENVRQVMVPLLTTTLQSPDALVAELSINALNNRDRQSGPVSRLYQANAAIITQIGGAHLAQIDNVADPLHFLATRKARIFEGLRPDSPAILNFDMPPRAYKVALQAAQHHAGRIWTYSLHDQRADAYLLKQVSQRETTTVTLQIGDETRTATLRMPGDGVIMDLLAACVTVKSLGLPLPKLDHLLLNFQALNSELKFHRLTTPKGEITIVDDTHGSTLHSVDNILSIFAERGRFYRGKKVLVMETGEDLGKRAADYNLQFRPRILRSHIDEFVGYRDAAIKRLVTALAPEMATAFYRELPAVTKLIETLPADSLVIIKSSDGRKYGSDLWQLPPQLIAKTK